MGEQLKKSAQRLKYDQIIDVLILLGRRQGGHYSRIDAEIDYVSDPVRFMKMAEQEVSLHKNQ